MDLNDAGPMANGGPQWHISQFSSKSIPPESCPPFIANENPNKESGLPFPYLENFFK